MMDIGFLGWLKILKILAEVLKDIEDSGQNEREQCDTSVRWLSLMMVGWHRSLKWVHQRVEDWVVSQVPGVWGGTGWNVIEIQSLITDLLASWKILERSRVSKQDSDVTACLTTLSTCSICENREWLCTHWNWNIRFERDEIRIVWWKVPEID